MYTLRFGWEDFEAFDEDDIPGIFKYGKDEFNSLDTAVNAYFAHISFDDVVEIYNDNKNIESDILYNEDFFKKFFEDKDALQHTNFAGLTYDEAWKKVVEYRNIIRLITQGRNIK